MPNARYDGRVMGIGSSDTVSGFRTLFEGFSNARLASARAGYQGDGRFRSFLEGFLSARLGVAQQASKSIVRFERLFKNYAIAHSRSTRQAEQIAQSHRQEFRCLFEGYLKALDIWEKNQRGTADRFDILEVLDATGDELRHSRMLAWLLDRNYRKFGTHAQGSLGFRLLLAELGLPLELAEAPYSVRREVSGMGSRIDIEVEARGFFLMHIEVKINAAEGVRQADGVRQTDREWDDLCRRAREIGVSDDPQNGKIFALYLTPSGIRPSNRNFIPVRWGRIISVLKRFGTEAQPAGIKLFALHYARALGRFVLQSAD